MSVTEQPTSEPVRDCVTDRLMLAVVAERLLGGQPGAVPKIGRFVVLHEIGAGGMGQVFAAYDPQLDRKIALKVLQPQASTDVERASARLHAEAIALARLSHPNVVTVFEAGAVAGEIFLAMEFVEGSDMSSWARENPVPRPLRNDTRMEAAQALLLQAGQGLAAAHAAGLVHRDFKPSNVLVGLDGRTRVADFGLARAESGMWQERARQVTSSDLSASITRTGFLLGTPRYMAPEQQRDGTADALSDQFAFCTAAWEMLFGAHPWFGAPPDEELPAPPAGAPARLVAPLLRGLDPDPAARFPKLDDLLAELAPPADPPPQRWRWLAAGGLVVLAGGVGWAAQSERDAPCENLRAELDAVWGSERTPALREAVRSSGVPHADAEWSRLEQTVEPYVDRWAELRTRTCLATQSGGSSPTITSATLGCLAQRRRALTAFLDVVEEGTPSAVSKAVIHAQQLPSVALCGEADFVLTGFEAPQGKSAAEVEEIQDALARAAALRRAGEYGRANAVVAQHRDRVSDLGFPPLSQDFAFERAELAGATEDLALEEKLLLEAYAGASQSGRTSLALDAASQLAVALAVRGDGEAGRRWLAVAEAGQATNADAGWAATLLNRRGDVLLSGGDANDAVAAYAESASMREQLAGPDSIELVAPLKDLGAAQRTAGRFDEAKATLDRSLALARQLGDQHPVVASVLHTQMALALDLDESTEAHALAKEELAIYRATFGDQHSETAVGLISVAITTESLGRADEALELLQQADAIYERAGPGHRLARVYGLTGLSNVHGTLGRRDEAAKVQEHALSILRDLLPPSHPDLAAGVHNLAYARTRQGRYDEALALQREARDLLVRRLGPEHPDLAIVQGGMGASLMGLERYAEAEVEFTRQLELVTASVGAHHPTLAQPLYNLGHCAESTSRFDEAEAFYASSLATLDAHTTPDDPTLSYPLTGLARVFIASGRPHDAIVSAQRALDLLALGDLQLRADAQAALAKALWLAKRDRTRARTLADQAVANYATIGADANGKREALETWRSEHGL